jgi:hypothetical protein
MGEKRTHTAVNRVTDETLSQIEERAKHYMSTHPKDAEIPTGSDGKPGGTLMKGIHPIAEHMPQVYGEYYAAVEPEVVLALIGELREARKKAKG